MAEYRRAVGTQVWHWKPTCPDYPTQNFEISNEKPTTGEPCPECGVRE